MVTMYDENADVRCRMKNGFAARMFIVRIIIIIEYDGIDAYQAFSFLLISSVLLLKFFQNSNLYRRKSPDVVIVVTVVGLFPQS